MNGRRTRLSILGAILVLYILGLPATPALGSTAQEINALPVLDALNVHQEDMPSFNWHALSWTSSPSERETGQETTSGWGPWDKPPLVDGAYWKLTPYKDNSGDAAALTMQIGPGCTACYVGLWLDMPGPDSVKSGYQLRWTVNSGGSNYTVKLSKWSSGTETVIASNPSVSIAAGTTMAISDTGGTVSAWQGTGESLTSILSASDTTYTSGYAGIEGIGTASRSINFKAGPLMGAAVAKSAVLDSLERSESPIATSEWSKSSWAGEIGSTRMGSYRGYGSNSGVAGAYWNQESFNDNTGGTLVAATVGTGAIPEGQYFALWLDVSSSGTYSGYEARFTGGGSASNYKVEISKWSSGTRTVLASKTGFSLPVGTTMAFTKSGPGLVLWTGTSTATPVLSTTSGTYNKGYAGLEVSGGAGTVYNFRAARAGWPPSNTTILSGAKGVVLPQMSYSFFGSEGTSSFECSADGSAYAACASPKSYAGVPEGSHTFRVRAVGIMGTDETPDERSIQVVKAEKLATKVPLLDSLERSESPLASNYWLKSSWAAEMGGARIGSYRGYGSTGGLAGAYWDQKSSTSHVGTMVVSGTVGTGATPEGQYIALWLDMPSPSSARSGYEARFTGGGSASNYKVEISKWSSGTRTVLASKTGFSLPVGTTMALTETPGGTLALYTGTTTMSSVLSANDATYSGGYGGLEVSGDAGTIYNFRAGEIDVEAPETSIYSGPPEIGPPEKVAFTIKTSESGVTFECSLDGGAYNICTTPKTYPGLADGKHTFRVRATDIVGNQDETPAERTFWVYKQPKAVTQQTPDVNTAEATLGGYVNPNGLHTTYQFEYGPTTAYGSKAPATAQSIGEGTNELYVSQLISGLQGGTVYHYRLVATSPGGATYTEDRTFTVDRVAPAMTFKSTYSPASPTKYALNIHATDSGTVATGVKTIDILLNGEAVSSIKESCPGGQCPKDVETSWSHEFNHPLDGTDRLAIMILDGVGNVSSRSFDLPSEVVHAVLYSADPSNQAGKQIANEWAVVGTHDSRREDSAETLTRGVTECPQEPTDSCYSLRGVRVSNGEVTNRYSEATSPISEPETLSEAATLLVPAQSEAGEVVGGGSLSSIVQPWQTLPPGSGSTYTKIEASNAADQTQLAGTWIFWVDSNTRLPIKVSLQEGSNAPLVSYYSYTATPEEAGNLSPELFLQSPPTGGASQCVASGQLGSWTFNPAGFVNPDPEFSAVVVGHDGLITIEPEGAAVDGYDGRATLTQFGVELSSSAADEQKLAWEINETPGQILEPVGADVVIETPGGSPSAVIQPSSSGAVTVIDGEPNEKTGESADKVILEPSGDGAAAIATVKGSAAAAKSPCITNADMEAAAKVREEAAGAKAAALGTQQSGSGGTTPVAVWINPHPMLKGVTVTDKYGVCNAPHSKTFGEDGKVEFGGCPIGKQITLTVPSEVSVGSVKYTVPDSSRSFSPPAGGWRVDFNYTEQSVPVTEPPPGKGWYEPIRYWMEADEPSIEAEASQVTPLPPPPAYTCFGHMSAPFKSATALDYDEAAEAWWKIRCGPETYVDYWTVPDFRLESNKGKGWDIRKVHPIKGPGPALTTQGPYAVIAPCDGKGIRLGLPLGPAWRTAGHMHVFSEKPSQDITDKNVSGEHKMACG